jgi:tetratricopeptide (TPR) repeat protein
MPPRPRRKPLRLADAERAIVRTLDRGEVHRARAKEAAAAGDAQGAFDEVSRAIEVSPRDAWSHAARAVYRSNLDHDAALVTADFDRAVELAPTSLFARFHRSEWRFGLEDFAGALEDLDHAVLASPRYGRLYLERAATRGYVGDASGKPDEHRANLEASVVDLRTALELGVEEPVEVYFHLTFTLRDLGQREEATSAFERWCALAPDDRRLESIKNDLAKRSSPRRATAQ